MIKLRGAKVTSVAKPWGKELWFARGNNYVGKILTINRGHKISLQYHKVKHETIHVLKGRLKLELSGKVGILEQGTSAIIPTKAVHRFGAPFGRVTLLEVSTPEVWDVVRLDDDYGRVDRRKNGR